MESEELIKGTYKLNINEAAVIEVGGSLKLTIKSANLLNAEEAMSLSDPYCIVISGGKQNKTKYIDDGGENPVWNETFDYTISNMADEVVLRVMDKDTFKDDAMGEVKIKWADVCKNYGGQFTFSLMNKTKPAGTITTQAVYIPLAKAGHLDKSQNWDAQGTFEMVKKK